jgi:hypothetical protein
MKKKILIALSLILMGSICSKANVITLTIDSMFQESQIISVSSCDTIVVVNNSNYTDYFFTDTISDGVGNFDFQIQPDSILGEWGQEVSYFFDLSGLTHLAISHQLNPFYFYVNIEPCFPTSLNLQSIKTINLFPNPAQTRIYIETQLDDVSLSIVSANGENVQTIEIHKRITEVEIDQFESGWYFLKTTNKQGISSYQKFYKIP